MKIIFIQQEYDELIDAVEYYEERQIDLGLRMLDEVNQRVEWLLNNALVPRIRTGGYRIVNLKVFPYYIPYIIYDNSLWIIAIAHNQRNPIYWIKRMKN